MTSDAASSNPGLNSARDQFDRIIDTDPLVAN
jgi:hypothetical protein